jgi:hypothetical protein
MEEYVRRPLLTVSACANYAVLLRSFAQFALLRMPLRALQPCVPLTCSLLSIPVPLISHFLSCHGAFSLTCYSWDDWVTEDRLRKLTQENRDLANSLRHEVLAQQRAARAQPVVSKKKAQGSARGSEERQMSVQATGPRGQKRMRDHDLEKACIGLRFVSLLCGKLTFCRRKHFSTSEPFAF